MAETINRGPYFSIGSLEDTRVEPFDGPSISYQGDTIPNVLYSPAPKDGLAPGRIPVLFNSPYIVMSDNVPQKTNATTLVNGAVATALTAFPLQTAQVGASGASVGQLGVGVPFIPVGTTVVQTGLVIDFGFTTGTTTANSTTVAVVDNRLFTLGQWVVIPGVANTAATQALIAQVAAIATANTTGISLSVAAATALSNVPIGQGNLYSPFLPPATQFGPAAASASAWEPYQLAGLAKAFDPTQGIARNVTVLSTTGATAQILVTGYDIWFNKMAELITLSGTTSVAGKKAFKVITSIVPQQANAAGSTVNVGLGDVFGMNLRSDKWEYANIFYNGGFATTTAGWTQAVTSTATNTTGDVRGTVNGSTLATIGTSANGTARLTIMMSVPMYNMVNATPLNTVPLFGVAQATA